MCVSGGVASNNMDEIVMAKVKTIHTITVDLKPRLTRFYNYLCESDAYGLKHHGYATFQSDRDSIRAVGRIWDPYHPSRLTHKSAEKFANKLGDDILTYGEEIFNGMKTQPFCWQDVDMLGTILKLGWNIKFYNQG